MIRFLAAALAVLISGVAHAQVTSIVSFPGGSNYQLQVSSNSRFAGVQGSTVTGKNLALSGTMTATQFIGPITPSGVDLSTVTAKFDAVGASTAALASSVAASTTALATAVGVSTAALDAAKVAKAGDTMTGALVAPDISLTYGLSASTANIGVITTNEVYAAGDIVVDPTGDVRIQPGDDLILRSDDTLSITGDYDGSGGADLVIDAGNNDSDNLYLGANGRYLFLNVGAHSILDTNNSNWSIGRPGAQFADFYSTSTHFGAGVGTSVEVASGPIVANGTNASLTVTGAAYIGNPNTQGVALQFAPTPYGGPHIVVGTTDGSDTSSMTIVAGGYVNNNHQTRGASIILNGNEESSNAGNMILSAGNVAGSSVSFRTNGQKVGYFGTDGNLHLSYGLDAATATFTGNVGISSASPKQALVVVGSATITETLTFPALYGHNRLTGSVAGTPSPGLYMSHNYIGGLTGTANRDDAGYQGSYLKLDGDTFGMYVDLTTNDNIMRVYRGVDDKGHLRVGHGNTSGTSDDSSYSVVGYEGFLGGLNTSGNTVAHGSRALSAVDSSGKSGVLLGYAAGSGRAWAIDSVSNGSMTITELGQYGISDGFGEVMRMGHDGSVTTYSSMTVGGLWTGKLVNTGPTAFTGNVGIGTTNPGTKLHVSSGVMTVDGTGALICVGQPSGDFCSQANDGLGDSKLYSSVGGIKHVARSGYTTSIMDGSDTNVTILGSNGNVGIGTTSPGTKLHVSSGVVYVDGSGGGINLANGIPYRFSDGRLGINDDGGDVVAFNGGSVYPSGFYLRTASADNALRIIGNGNVGLGIASPISRLHVSTALPSDGTIAYFQDTTSNVGMRVLSNTTTSGLAAKHIELQADSSVSDLALSPSSDSRAAVVIKDGGNVGVGTTAPGTKLHVSSGVLTVDGTSAQLRVRAANGLATLESTSGATNGGELRYVGSTGSNLASISYGQYLGSGLEFSFGGGNQHFMDGTHLSIGGGTALPPGKLHVASGTIVVNGSGAGMSIAGSTFSVSSIGFVGVGIDAPAQPNTRLEIKSYGNSTIPFVVTPSGVTTPLARVRQGGSGDGEWDVYDRNGIGGVHLNGYSGSGGGSWFLGPKNGFGTAAPGSLLHVSSGVLTMDGNGAGISITTAPLAYPSVTVSPSNGYVGLYNNAPAVALEITSLHGGTGAQLRLSRNGTLGQYLQLDGGSGGGIISQTNNKPLSFHNDTTGGTATAFQFYTPTAGFGWKMMADGRLGVGADTPGTKLHVSSGVLTVDGTGAAMNIAGSTFTVGNDGIVTAPSQPAIHASTGTASFASGSDLDVYFGAETYDRGNIHDIANSSSTFTVPAGGSGLYYTNCTLRWNGNSGTPTRLIVGVHVNGSATPSLAGEAGPLAAATFRSVTASGVLSLSAGNTVKCKAYHNAGSPLQLDSASSGENSYFEMVKLW